MDRRLFSSCFAFTRVPILSTYFDLGQNQWYHSFSGDWDVHWGYGLLTHGQIGLGHFFGAGTERFLVLSTRAQAPVFGGDPFLTHSHEWAAL